MSHRFYYIFIFFLLFLAEVRAQDVSKKPEEIVVVEGEKYIFKSSFGTKFEVLDRNIAVNIGNGVIKAKRRGASSILAISSLGVEKIRLTVLPKRKVNLMGEYPILAWYSLKEDLSKERYMELADAGFNISYSYETDSIVNQMRRAIKAVKGTGVKLLIPFRGPWVDVKPIVEYFKHDENLWGWFVTDEPSYDIFGDVKSFMDRIKSVDSTHPFYINLLPTYASKSSFPNGSYEQYVNSFVKLFSPSFLSFDHYPITNKGVRKDFFKNLNIISSIANQNKIPFWAFACSVKFNGNVPAPKLEHLKLEVFSALAFGAQGIEYFTYTTPRKEHGGNHFSHAPFDANHKKTKTYDYVKEVNTRLRSVEHYFKDAKVINIGALGGNIDGIEKYHERSLPKGVKSISSTNTLLASCLQNDLSNIFVLVNTNIDKDAIVTIDSGKSIQKISNDGQLVSVSSIEILLPGDMLIYLVGTSENGNY